MSSLQVTGTLIHKEETQYVNDKFRKREFVIELNDEVNGNVYKNYAKMQVVQNKCDILDGFKIGDTITADFNIKGNRWEKDGKAQYITNLDAWRISGAHVVANNVTNYDQYSANGGQEVDPMPF